MASSTCWKCLTRPSYPLNPPLTSVLPTATIVLPVRTRCAPFSSSSTTQAVQKKIAPKGFQAKKGNLGLKKKKRTSDGRPPAIGERKALRKRVILSNTNALEVEGMAQLSKENLSDESLRGQVLSIPGPIVDSLRAMEAFKPSQGWGLYRRPGFLMRGETFELAKLIQQMGVEGNKKSLRRIYTGERGSGKSLMLLQASTMALLHDWVIINLFEAQELIIGHTEYGPLPNVKPPLYNQKKYVSSLLDRIVRANSTVLDKLILSQTHNLPVPIQTNMTLSRLCQLGASDPEIAWPVFQAMWTELTAPSTKDVPRPKLLLSIDSLSHVMKDSAYRSASFEPIHAHDLALVRWFMDYFSGRKSLPNGGLILAATSESNNPNIKTVKFRISQLEAESAVVPESTIVTQTALMQPFLEATGQTANPIPQPDPFYKYDERVLDVFQSDREVPIEARRMRGLTKEEARGLMEYWGKSGLIKTKISEGFVGEKWTLAGNGIIGELERGCVRMRV